MLSSEIDFVKFLPSQDFFDVLFLDILWWTVAQTPKNILFSEIAWWGLSISDRYK